MKTVIEMARSVGFWQEHIDTWMCNTKDIEHLVELVRADERKKWEDQTAVEIHEAVLDEREAMVAEAAKQGWAMKNEDPFEDAVREIAAIRAIGEMK